MTLHLAEAWNAVSTSPVLGVALTLAAYQLARTLWLRAGNQPGVDPVLIAIVLVGLVLWVTGIDYDTYMRGGSVIALLLGPATIALAWPLHLEMALVRRAVVPILVSIALGSAVAAARRPASIVIAACGGGGLSWHRDRADDPGEPDRRGLQRAGDGTDGAGDVDLAAGPRAPAHLGL